MIRNLKDTTWKINDIRSYAAINKSVWFSSRSQSFKQIIAEIYSYGIQWFYHIQYVTHNDEKITVYEYNGTTGAWWAHQDYRTIKFDADKDAEDIGLLNWIKQNATFVPLELYVHFYPENKKVLVDAAIRDSAGYIIADYYTPITSHLVLKDEIKTLKTSIYSDDGLISTSTAHTSAIQELNKRLDQITDKLTPKQIDALLSAFATLENINLSELASKVTLHNSLISEVKSDFSALEKEFQTTNKNVSDIEAKVNENVVLVDAQNTKLAELEHRINNLPVTPEDMVEFHQRLDSVTGIVDTANQNAAAANQNANEAKGLASAAKTEVDNLKAKVNANEKRSLDNEANLKSLSELFDATKKALEAEDKSLWAEINEIKSLDLNALKNDVNQLSGLGATVAVHERQITQLISDVATNTNNIEINQSAITGHTTHLKEIDTSIENLNELLKDTVKTEELLALGQTVTTHTNQIDELYNITNNHENRLKNAEDKLSDQGQLLNTARADLDEQKDEIAIHHLQIQQLQTDYAALNLSPTDVVNIKNSINEFEEDIDNIENLVTDMTSTIATNANQISNLKIRIDDADGNISINRGIIDEHGQDILRQGMEIDELRKEIDSKQANLVPGTNIEIVYNEETKETIINSTAQINNNWGGITGDITEQEDLIEILSTKVEVSDEEPTDVEFSYQNQIDELKSQLRALQKQLNGLTFVPTTQDEYEDLGTYDENTVYIAKEN